MPLLMRGFIIKAVVYFICTILLASIKPMYLYSTGKYKTEGGRKWVYTAIAKSQKKVEDLNLLIFGDSVCNQIFSVFNDKEIGYCSLATPAPTTIVGQYIMANEFLSHSEPKVICIISSPLSFRFDLTGSFTYNYFIKPFNRKQNETYFSDQVKEAVNSFPYASLAQLPHILTTDWAPEAERSSIPATEKFFSDISIEYLNKFRELSEKHNIPMYVLPVPTPKVYEKTIVRMREEIEIYGLSDLFTYYDQFEELTYQPLFKDGIHYSPLVIPRIRKKLLQDIEIVLDEN